MATEDPNYHARQEVMSLYRGAQDMQRRLVDVRKVAHDSNYHLTEAYTNITNVMRDLSHWLHELDKGPLMAEVPTEVVQLQLTEPESRAVVIEDYKKNHHA